MLSARLVLVRHGQSTYNAQGASAGAGRPTAFRRRPRGGASGCARTCRRFDARRSRATSCARARPPRCSAIPDARARRRAGVRSTSASGRAGRSRSSPTSREAAWRGGPLHAAGRRVLGRVRRRASAARSTSWSPTGGDVARRLPRRRRARGALARHRRRSARAIAGPGERQRHGDPVAAPAAARDLRLDARDCHGRDRRASHRKFLGEAAFQPVRRPHPGAFAGRLDQVGTGRPAQWGRRVGRLPPLVARRRVLDALEPRRAHPLGSARRLLGRRRRGVAQELLDRGDHRRRLVGRGGAAAQLQARAAVHVRGALDRLLAARDRVVEAGRRAASPSSAS